jgi:hypothetical protein
VRSIVHSLDRSPYSRRAEKKSTAEMFFYFRELGTRKLGVATGRFPFFLTGNWETFHCPRFPKVVSADPRIENPRSWNVAKVRMSVSQSDK